MLTVTSAFTKAMAKNAQLAAIVEIRTAASGIGGYRFSFADRRLFGTNPSVVSITPVAPAIDHLTRVASLSEVSVEFVDDGRLRDLIKTDRIVGGKLTITVGSVDIGSSDFAPYFEGQIDELSPTEGGFELVAHDVRFSVLQQKLRVATTNDHPYEVMEKIFTAVDGFPSGLLVSSTFDPDTDTAVSHWNVARISNPDDYQIPSDPSPAIAMLEELQTATNASILPREDGAISVKRYDPLGSTVADWGPNVIRGFEQVSTWKHLINRVSVLLGYREGAKYGRHPLLGVTAPLSTRIRYDVDDIVRQAMERASEYRYRFEHNDDDSQGDFRFPGETKRILEHQFGSRWLGATAYLALDISTTGAVTFIARDGAIAGFTGLRDYDPIADTQPAGAEVSASRPAYILIDEEIVKVTTVTGSTTDPRNFGVGADPALFVYTQDFDVKPDPPAGSIVPAFASFDVAAAGDRGQFGTTPATHSRFDASLRSGGRCIDFTIAIHLAQALIERYSQGARMLSIETDLSQYAVQLGDLVRVSNDVFASFGLSGLGFTDATWEVVGKEIDWTGSPPMATWTLAEVRQNSFTQSFQVDADLVGPDANQQQGRQNAAARVHSSYVANGLTVTDAGGLNVTISAGEAAGAGGFVGTRTTTVGLTASLDHYLGIDGAAHFFVDTPVAIGSPEPALGPTEIRFARVRTGASTITRIDDFRKNVAPPNKQLRQGQIAHETAPHRSLIPNGDFQEQSSGPQRLPDFFSLHDPSLYLVPDHARITTTAIKSGKQALQLTNATGSANVRINSDRIPVESVAPYTAQAMIFADSTTPIITVRVRKFDQNLVDKGTVNIVSAVVPTINTWFHHALTFDTGSDDKFVQIEIIKSTDAGNVAIDEVTLHRELAGFHAYNAANQTIAVDTDVLLQLPTEEHDHGNIWNPSTHILTARRAGVYSVGASVSIAMSSSGKAAFLKLQREPAAGGGFTDLKVLDAFTVTQGNQTLTLSGGTTTKLAVNDKLRFVVRHNDTSAGGNRDLVGGRATVYAHADQVTGR